MSVRLVQGINDLETWCSNNGERGQRLLDEWDWEENFKEGFHLAPCDLHALSAKKVLWRCSECNNVFRQAINLRVSEGQGCPLCGKKNGGKKNRQRALDRGSALYDWCGRNGERGERLLQEWDTEKNLEEFNVTPKDIVYSFGKKVHWKCSLCNASFMCTVDHRTVCGTNCTKCAIAGTSYPEQFLFYGLKQLCPETMNREKFFDGLEYDIFVPEWNLYIEYGSSFYHEKKQENDDRKRRACIESGGRFINVFDDEKATEEYFSESLIVVNIYKRHDEEATYERILDYILKMNHHSIEEIDLNRLREDCNRRMAKNVADGKDVRTLYPELVEEWIPKLNHGAQPDNHSYGSHKLIKWKCKRCGNVWKNSIHSRIGSKSGCPRCGYCIFDDKIHAPNKERGKYRVFSIQQFV